MALRPVQVLIVVLLVLAAVLFAALWHLSYSEPDPDPFHMTLLVSGTEANVTDANLTDSVLWVAVAGGEPKPRWTQVEVTLVTNEGCQTLGPPRLELQDQDGDERVTQGDLLSLFALNQVEMGGRVALWHGGSAIGTVELHHGN